MKIIKIAQSELLEGYEREDQKFVRANIFAAIVGGSWIFVIWLFKIGYLTLN